MLVFHQSRNELDSLGHFRQVGRNRRNGRPDGLVIDVLRWTCVSSDEGFRLEMDKTLTLSNWKLTRSERDDAGRRRVHGGDLRRDILLVRVQLGLLPLQRGLQCTERHGGIKRMHFDKAESGCSALG